MTLDLNKLKSVVVAINSSIWEKEDVIESLHLLGNKYHEIFVKTFSPSVVKELIARIEQSNVLINDLARIIHRLDGEGFISADFNESDEERDHCQNLRQMAADEVRIARKFLGLDKNDLPKV